VNYKPSKNQSIRVVTELVRRKGEASLLNTSRTGASLGYSLFEKQVCRLLSPSRGLMVITTADRGLTPSDRIGGIMRDMDELDRIPGFVIIDHVDDLLNDATDLEELDALMGLAKIWAGELGCHVALLNRCN
jgi:Ni,Fe-hydrogenase III large subunit